MKGRIYTNAGVSEEAPGAAALLDLGLVRLGCMPFAATGGTREKVPDCTRLPPHVSLDSKDERKIWKGVGGWRFYKAF